MFQLKCQVKTTIVSFFAIFEMMVFYLLTWDTYYRLETMVYGKKESISLKITFEYFYKVGRTMEVIAREITHTIYLQSMCDYLSFSPIPFQLFFFILVSISYCNMHMYNCVKNYISK